jgi:surface protein
MTFISQWKTDNSGGISANNEITLPLESSGTYNFTVNWGDNSSDVITTWNQPATTHTYAIPGTYTVTIAGTIIGFRFADTGDKTKIINISQWGDLRVGNNNGYFSGCLNLNSTAIDALNLTGTTNLSYTFASAKKFNGVVNNWDVSNVTTIQAMFYDANAFNQPLNNWNVSNVTNINSLFTYAVSFNQPLNNWNTSNIIHANFVFFIANVFNQPIDNWNVSNVTSMAYMFYGASSFNQPLNNWNVSNVSDMNSMFTYANSFNQDLSLWCVSQIPFKPTNFDVPGFNWIGGDSTRPQWGTCPSRNIPGSVTISGNTVRGETLTATVTDADGTPNNINYQWQSSTDNGISWSNIVGATDYTLLLTTDLVGRRIRVTASYTDNLGTSEAITSAPTATVTHINIPGSVTISGNTVRGETLTATVTDADGTPNNINYQWQSSTDNGISWSNIVGATDYTLLLTTALVGRRIRVTAGYTDNLNTGETIASEPTATVTHINIPGSVTISGNTVRGNTLTATVTDADGTPNNINYQWQSSTDNGISWSNIVGATDYTLLLTTALVGRRIRVTASYTDNLSTGETITSAPTATVTHINIPGSVTISGNTVRGETLTATVTDADGTPNNIIYQWQSSTDNGISWSNIVGATDYTLLLTTALVGRRIRVTAGYTDNLNTGEAIVSEPTNVITHINIPGAVTISGNTVRGNTLTATVTDADGIPNNISYQWQSSTDNGISWSNIVGATSFQLALVNDLVGRRIRVTAGYTDNLGTSETVASTPTATVTTIEIIGILTITGDHRQYKVLTAIIEDLNGVNESTVTYQWQKSIDGIQWINIAEATIDKLYLKATYQNHFIRVASTYQTLGGNLVELTSDRTDLIASPFSILDFVKTNNFYTQSPLVNAVFTLESFPGWIIDTETGNLVPDSTGNNVIICTATVQQKKDPNLVVQSGVDYNRIYFEGYLINPKTLLDVEQGKNITAVINSRQGIFDFVPVIESGQEISLRQREVNGQRIAGYFRLKNMINS